MSISLNILKRECASDFYADISKTIIMKRFKKIMRLSGLVLMIVLASFGIGINGGVPVPRSNRREDPIEIKMELVESEEEDNDEIDIKL